MTSYEAIAGIFWCENVLAFSLVYGKIATEQILRYFIPLPRFRSKRQPHVQLHLSRRSTARPHTGSQTF